MPIDTNLRAELEAMDAEYGGENIFRILGPTSLSYTSTDSSREYMFTSHLKQFLTLLNPDIPRLQTGFENTVGKRNRAYKQLEGTWEVMDIIQKYPGFPSLYTIVLFNRKKNMYEMIEKKFAESRTEKFGYAYNTEVMDSLSIGDTTTNPILYRSTSYDKHMNYRYGKNAQVFFSTSTDTLEDAILVRRSWAEGVKTVEVDSVDVSINENDVLLNLYGDAEHYQAFPELGESVRNSILCATRKLNKNHLFYDFQEANISRLQSTDTEYYTTKGSVLYDINIYYNGDDPFPDTVFYQQLKKYYDMQTVYADRVYAWATKIKKSGSNYSNEVIVLRSKYMHFTDPEYKWKDKDRAFANLRVEFLVRTEIGLDHGSKLSGRYGDKGVIGAFAEDLPQITTESILDLVTSEASDEEKAKLAQSIQIIDDDRMPYTDDGPIDILLNMSGMCRRLNPAQAGEVEVNFQARQIQLKLKELGTLEEKIEMIFKFLHIINQDESEFFLRMYQDFDRIVDVGPAKIHLYSDTDKEDFVRYIEENGFYLVRPPHKPLLYKDIVQVYKEFPWIKPVPIYINLFGVKKRRLMRDGVVGSKYIIVLKQNSNKNFSARSTYRVNRSNLPTKDIAKKTNRSSYARTAVRLSEIYNLLASVSGRDIAEWNTFVRTSALGRKSLERILAADGNPLRIHKLKIRDNYINTNADILAARLKAIGLRIDFYTSDNMNPDLCFDFVTELKIGRYTIMASPKDLPKYKAIFDAYDRELESFSMLESFPGQKQELCWDRVFESEEIKPYELSDSDKELLRMSTRTMLSNLEDASDKTRPISDLEQSDADDDSVESPPVKRRRGRRAKVTANVDGGESDE